jgi:hypothetical protein
VDDATPVVLLPYSAPLPYSGRVRPETMPIASRLLAIGLALGCLTVLLIAARLTPDPHGYGSHTGKPLGMASCQFMERTGLPCPSCGMTTSFTWFVRGNVAASIYVQPMGAMLAFLAACSVWVGLYIGLTGRPVHRLLRLVPSRYYLVPLFALAILAWAWKILIHVHGWDGW